MRNKLLSLSLVYLFFTPLLRSQTVVYSEDFETRSSYPEWTTWAPDAAFTRIIHTQQTPIGTRKFLGEFGNQKINLSIGNLPKHKNVCSLFDLFALKTLDGIAPSAADYFNFSEPTSGFTYRTTFANFDNESQSYPDPYGGGTHPRWTGSLEHNTLGYVPPYPPGNTQIYDAVYRLQFSMKHSSGNSSFDIEGLLSDGAPNLDNESSGIDNVTVIVDGNCSSVVRPSISYILPDIGTPGMNTYVEVIGPHDVNGNFGTDGIYPNNPGDAVRVVCVNNIDTNKVTMGPVVVSWNGKMITTQVFVHPNILPPSSDWKQGIKIPLRVIVSAISSNIDTFFIVKPQPFGFKNTPGLIGSGNGWGTRSKRGAMIVDDMILNSATRYTFDTSDCDPYTMGNQGFLPTIILSKNTLTISSNAILSIDGNGIDGGPGGGGGGHGEWSTSDHYGCPVGNPPYLKNGLGFTNGGGSSWLCDGINGLNGCLAGECPQPGFAREGGGGGTGFPFSNGGLAGHAGSQCTTPTQDCSGGSGGADDPWRGGGGGGYASSGAAAPGCTSNGGNIAGNAELIPLAGGSGGAGGNGFCCNVSGNGGGGGGAIGIHAKKISIESITAVGASGMSGSWNGSSCGGKYGSTAGGGGSGGGIYISSKIKMAAPTINVEGGLGGVSKSRWKWGSWKSSC